MAHLFIDRKLPSLLSLFVKKRDDIKGGGPRFPGKRHEMKREELD